MQPLKIRLYKTSQTPQKLFLILQKIIYSIEYPKEEEQSSLVTLLPETMELKFKEDSFEVLNHSCAHLLASAIKKLYPNAQFGVGPAIEEGFYYDVDLGDVKLNDTDLEKIEKQMAKIVAGGENIKRFEVSKEQALDLFKDDVYKTELINELPQDVIITVYEQGPYRDLCRGPHVSSVKFLKNFKFF